MSLGTCAVIGGRGWLGGFLVAQLSRDADVKKPVLVFDVVPPPQKPGDEGQVVHKVLDIRDAQGVREGLEGVDTVFHCAAVIDIRLFPGQLCRDVNVGGTANVLNACRAQGVKRMVYTSTLDVIGGGLRGQDESTAYCTKTFNFNPLYVAPPSGYYRTKSLAEQMVLDADGHGGLVTVALRMSHIFGVGDDVIPLVAGSPVATGSASARCSFVYVENGAYAHILGAKKLISSPKTTRKSVFLITDFDANFSDMYRQFEGKGPYGWMRVPFFILAFAAIVMELLAAVLFLVSGLRMPWTRDGKLTFGLAAMDGMRQHTVNGSKAVRVLGYKPPVAKEEAVVRTREWVSKTGAKRGPSVAQ